MPTREEALALVAHFAEAGRSAQALADNYIAARNVWMRALVDAGLTRQEVATAAGLGIDRMSQVLQRERARGSMPLQVELDRPA